MRQKEWGILLASIAILVPLFFFGRSILSLSWLHDSIESDGTAAPRTIQRLLTNEELTVFSTTIGIDTIAQVQKRWGGPIYMAGSQTYIICYFGQDGTTISFEATTDQRRPEKIVTLATIFADKRKYQFSSKCMFNKEVSRDLKLFGVQLGMSKNEVRSLRGETSIQTKDSMAYLYKAEIRKDSVIHGVFSNLEIQFLDNRTSQISLSKTESL